MYLKKAHLKKKFCFEVRALQLQRQLHWSVMLRWMPNSTMTQILERSESQPFHRFQSTMRHQSSCWCISGRLWNYFIWLGKHSFVNLGIKKIHIRIFVKHCKNKTEKVSTRQAQAPNTGLSWQEPGFILQVQVAGPLAWFCFLTNTRYIVQEWEAGEEPYPCYCTKKFLVVGNN